jgi:Stress responsive A/B Barrel Domain
VIRSVIMVDLKAGVIDEQVTALREALAAVPFERRRSFMLGRDLNLVENTVDLVLISEFDDEQAYRDWSVDPGHRAVSAQYLRPIAERISRGQIEI